MASRFLEYLTGIETEALQRAESLRSHVFRVPYRDWNENLASFQSSHVSFLFLEYLTGIETDHSVVFFNYFPLFLEYLTGIETITVYDNWDIATLSF